MCVASAFRVAIVSDPCGAMRPGPPNALIVVCSLRLRFCRVRSFQSRGIYHLILLLLLLLLQCYYYYRYLLLPPPLLGAGGPTTLLPLLY
jgi:hypothetical protein